MGLENGMFLMGSSHVNREDSSSNNLAAIPNSSTGRASQETSQLLPSRHHFNHWKHADSSMKSKGRDDSRKTYETKNGDGKENSSNSHNQGILGSPIFLILQTRQHSSNFFGVHTEFDCHNKPSRGFSIYESQQENGSENLSTSVKSESSESPVSFDIFGCQQQMSVQQTSMLQSLPRQQSELSDMQLLQQQVMLRKMQELQRRQQIQQLEAI
ncbi:uncharacterized protein LOC130773698 [Actinidia eriantha]|uniref:uncharacterized protein LOC130773698 n=1 Tax=Actinidia eriantha TaxID=165200 RepID=UPI00258E2377|nr:uncharacterized protein LOC130773698 [Actinidia eriantha]